MRDSVNQKTVDRLRKFTEELEGSDQLSPKYTCRKVTLNLNPQPFDPERVRQARKLVNLSQALFAEFIGVSTSTVQDWEQGRYTPEHSSCRLMDEIIRDPKYWQDRVSDAATVTA